MTDPQLEPRRLDSWKAIAAHLNRDERTVRRWEQELGLPIRRLPGGRGRSVFAYVEELDAWLKGIGAAGEVHDGEAATESATGEARVPTWRRLPAIVASAAGIVLMAAAWAYANRAPATPLRILTTPEGIRASTPAGALAWTYQFSTEYGWSLPTFDMAEPSRAMAGDHPAVYVATGYKVRRADEQAASGELYEFTPHGRLVRTFAFTDTVTIGGKSYGPPWAIASFAVSDSAGHRRLIVSAHHYIWGASLVAVLDDTFRRTGTFVHDGWIEAVRWIGSDRVLATGFSNRDDAGTALLLAADSIHKPIKTVLFPRSDLNRATHSRFNRAVPQLTESGFLIRTLEMPSQGLNAVADVIYEFTPSLDLVSSRYSDRYREAMRELGRAIGDSTPGNPKTVAK